MQVAIDHQAFSLQKYGGVSRYFYQLVERLHQHINLHFQVFYAANRYLDTGTYPHKQFPANRNFKGKLPLLRAMNNPRSCRWLKKLDFDLMHPSYYDPYFLKCIGNKPFVVTVHDMTHELYPAEFSPFDKTPQWKKLLVGKAERIIAVSENTRNDLVQMLGVDPGKIDVVYHGAPLWDVNDSGCNEYGLPEQYLLYIGARNAYKNFSTLARAFARLKEKHKALKLVVIGGGAFRADELELLKGLKILERVYKRSGDDKLLGCAYRKAEAFVFPSMYEGFGIPMLEAFANQCPVVAANKSSLPEVGGDAALYFDPESPEELSTQLDKLLKNKNAGMELRRKGTERVKAFTWDETAKQTLAVYQKALKQS